MPVPTGTQIEYLLKYASKVFASDSNILDSYGTVGDKPFTPSYKLLHSFFDLQDVLDRGGHALIPTNLLSTGTTGTDSGDSPMHANRISQHQEEVIHESLYFSPVH